jgi:uncharacterized membrane protein
VSFENLSVDPTARRRLAMLSVAAAVFVAAMVAAPWLASRSGWGFALHLAYRPMCHQLPDRCFDLGAGPLAVCARCTGLYIGGLVGLWWPVVTGRVPRLGLRALLVAAAPSVVDFGLGLAGLPSLANLPRALVALPLGLVLGLLLAQGLAEILRPRRSNRRVEDSVQ